MPKSPRRAMMTLLSAFACACSSDATSSGDQLAEVAAPLRADGVQAQPLFLSLDPNAPPLAATSASFYAVKGDNRELTMWYRPRVGQTDSTRLLRFRVGNKSLCRRPDGTPIAPGDSILITLTVVDAAKQIVDYQPQGLRFCSGRPAQLNLWYLETNHDYDSDGDIDGRDAAIERRFAIYGRETVADPWVKLTTIVSSQLDEVEADIRGFTNYVVAY